jgi:hypothetical protein
MAVRRLSLQQARSLELKRRRRFRHAQTVHALGWRLTAECFDEIAKDLDEQYVDLLGFVDVGLPSGMIVRGIKLMRGPKGMLWVGAPDQGRRDKNDEPVLDPDGKPIWDAVIEFSSRETGDRFNPVVLTALRRVHPELWDDEPPPRRSAVRRSLQKRQAFSPGAPLNDDPVDDLFVDEAAR